MIEQSINKLNVLVNIFFAFVATSTVINDEGIVIHVGKIGWQLNDNDKGWKVKKGLFTMKCLLRSCCSDWVETLYKVMKGEWWGKITGEREESDENEKRKKIKKKRKRKEKRVNRIMKIWVDGKEKNKWLVFVWMLIVDTYYQT